MKTVTIEGEDYLIPDDANWIASRMSGKWSWFSIKPHKDTIYKYWYLTFGTGTAGLVCPIAILKPNPHWESTLQDLNNN